MASSLNPAAAACGQWFLTGSQDFALMRGVTESMAGRAAILQLLPLSVAESNKVSPWGGGYAEVLARPRDAALWYQSYIQTYIEPSTAPESTCTGFAHAAVISSHKLIPMYLRRQRFDIDMLSLRPFMTSGANKRLRNLCPTS